MDGDESKRKGRKLYLRSTVALVGSPPISLQVFTISIQFFSHEGKSFVIKGILFGLHTMHMNSKKSLGLSNC